MSIASENEPAIGSPVLRLRADQSDQIARVREFRREAESLRTTISSRGRYGSEEANRFWALARNASFTLTISNPELAERAGLGSGFFTSVARDKRKPKLENFIRALATVIEVANERLQEVDADNSRLVDGSGFSSTSNIVRDRAEILQLAVSLAQMAKDEIERIRLAPANHRETIERQKRELELLSIFADGFDQIAQALLQFDAIAQDENSLDRVQKVVAAVGKQFDLWWKDNAAQAVDLAIKIPVFVGSVAALGWAGADMTVGTSAVAVLVGGDKVADVIKGFKKSK